MLKPRKSTCKWNAYMQEAACDALIKPGKHSECRIDAWHLQNSFSCRHPSGKDYHKKVAPLCLTAKKGRFDEVRMENPPPQSRKSSGFHPNIGADMSGTNLSVPDYYYPKKRLG